MLRGSSSRRIATVLTTALVAVLLVPFAGPARAAQHRTTAAPTHATAATHAARATHAVPSVLLDQVHQLDASTPPSDDAVPMVPGHHDAEATVGTRQGTSTTTPTGRGPPAR